MTIKGELLDAVREEPGITTLQLWVRTGLKPGEVWVNLSALQQEGRVKRLDNGWRVVDRAE
jgi:predicted Rossmann fold nucleotide-binding protein DprA/Smf involved in DNA uptake